MNVDVVSLRHWSDQENGKGVDVKDVAFPVLAIECEVNVPSETELDAYEEAVLKLVDIGLSAKGIAQTLRVALSLAGQLLINLRDKKFVSKKGGCPWEVTEDGKKYLGGIRELRPSGEGRYGYMFVSAIKKDILPYFHEGDISRIDRSSGLVAGNKLTLHDESAMFNLSEPVRPRKLEQVYERYLEIRELEKRMWERDDDMTLPDAQDACAGAGFFENADSGVWPVEETLAAQKGAAMVPGGHRAFLVRPLKLNKPKELYLQMRIIGSPGAPEGFRIESPLDLNGIDNEFFWRQILWMRNSGEVRLAGRNLSEIFNVDEKKPTPEKDRKGHRVDKSEKQKSDAGKSRDEYIKEYIMTKMPLLYNEKDGRYADIYSTAGHYIYRAVTEKNISLDKEDIVCGINRKLLEKLMNMLLLTVRPEMFVKISKVALDDIKFHEAKYFTAQIAKISCVSKDLLPYERKWVENAVRDLGKRWLGSSIFAKLYNVLVVYIYGKSDEIERFVRKENLEDYIRKVKKLKDIRNVAGHTGKGAVNSLKDEDYDYYIENFSDIANRILESLKKEVSRNE